MRKILISTVAVAAIAVVPAMASKPASHPSHPNNKPAQPSPKAKGRCKPKHVVGYNATGTLVGDVSGLTQDAGATTWSGTITVHITKANHKGATGDQPFTLTNVKVSLYDAANDGTPDTPVAGDTVRLHGTIGHAPKKCNLQAPVITIKRVSFQPAAPTT